MSDEPLPRLGPAHKARKEGRTYAVQVHPHPFTVRIDDDGQPKTRIAPYGGMAGACRLCPARCCFTRVTISIPDAMRYSTTLGVPLFSGVTIVPSEHADHAFRMDEDPRWSQKDGPAWPGRAELALRRRDDGRCHALVDIGGYLRCGVYAARPSFCRTYPVRWTSAVAAGGPAVVHCPLPYGITDRELRDIEREVERSIDEWELHDDIVAAWNESDGPWTIEAFATFALHQAESALNTVAEDALATGSAEHRLADAMQNRGLAPALTAMPKRPVWAGLPARPTDPPE